MQHLPTLGKAHWLTRDERYTRELVSQVNHWLDDNPCLIGINWTCAMEVAIRFVNILWSLAFVDDRQCLSIDSVKRVYATIWEHGQYLVRHSSIVSAVTVA